MCDVKQYFYDTDHNIMTDEDGIPLFNIYEYVAPWMLFLFLQKKECMIFDVGSGCFIELLYPRK